jgi:hypothetical protein
MCPTQNGDLHLNVRGLNMFLGTQVRQLAVFPTDVVAEFEVDR